MNEQIYNVIFEKLHSTTEIIPPMMKWKTVKSEEYSNLYRESIKDIFSFWQREAKFLAWYKSWDRIYSGNPPHATWFQGGRISGYHNIIGKHKNTWIWNKTAIIWEGEEHSARSITYGELDSLVNRIAYSMIQIGLKPGDWMVIYSPPLIESIAAMLAAIKIGAPFEPVFTGFGYRELAKRIRNRNPKLVFVSDGFYRRGKIVDTLQTLRNALEYAGARKNVVVFNRIGAPSLRENEILIDDFTSVNLGVEDYVANNDHPLFGLHSAYREDYKPITHPTGGFLVQVYSTSRWIGIRPRDTYFCTVWPGWITGVSYVVFGPLMIGSSVLLYDGGPDYPSWDRWWSLIEDYAVTLFLTTGGALRLFSKRSEENVRKHNLDTLKAILVTAEPLEADVWWWTYRVVGTGYSPIIDSAPGQLTGRIPVVNLYIQSEIGTFVTGNLINYTFTPIVPGSTGTPIPGFHIAVSKNNNVDYEGFGEILLLDPWPSMPIEFPPEYIAKWEKGHYRTGDYGYISHKGYIYVLGRIDGVLKTSGYRLSPGAVEKVLRETLGLNAITVPCLDNLKFMSYMLIYHGDKSEVEVREIIRQTIGAISDPAETIRVEADLLEKIKLKLNDLILPTCEKEALSNLI
ncbi:MAG: AMP-binding protein [Desulfurococcaceae archaeon]